jgi:hypothetical protein
MQISSLPLPLFHDQRWLPALVQGHVAKQHDPKDACMNRQVGLT